MKKTKKGNKGINVYIKSVFFSNFRNYTSLSTTFDKGLNIIVGENAVGKTNLVESIYFAALGRSPRTAKEKELIKWGEGQSYIKVTLSKRYREHIIEIYITEGQSKKITMDKLPITRISDLVGIINVSYFSPDELAIVKEGPSERRRFMDIAISQQKRSYFTDLVDYNHIIDQRNKLLKTVRDRAVLKQALYVWDIQLARIGARIINNRYIFIDQLATIAKDEHSYLTGGGESLGIEYEGKIARADVADMEKELLTALQESIDRDIHMQHTTVGCHRDDMLITLGGTDLRKYGSQGQKRTASLSLKLSEVVLIERETGEKPILILDDVLSELDLSRQHKLLERARLTQTMLTCTSFSGECNKRITILGGGIVEEKDDENRN